jgi:mRNA deadenylase 3'-5' endonuclease subunit Ccr4
MDSNSSNNRSNKVLFWNIRGINSQEKWDAIGEKINENDCHVLCLQETKRESFDNFYIRNFVLDPWINLPFFPPLVHLEAF